MSNRKILVIKRNANSSAAGSEPVVDWTIFSSLGIIFAIKKI